MLGNSSHSNEGMYTEEVTQSSAEWPSCCIWSGLILVCALSHLSPWPQLLSTGSCPASVPSLSAFNNELLHGIVSEINPFSPQSYFWSWCYMLHGVTAIVTKTTCNPSGGRPRAGGHAGWLASSLPPDSVRPCVKVRCDLAGCPVGTCDENIQMYIYYTHAPHTSLQGPEHIIEDLSYSSFSISVSFHNC